MTLGSDIKLRMEESVPYHHKLSSGALSRDTKVSSSVSAPNQPSGTRHTDTAERGELLLCTNNSGTYHLHSLDFSQHKHRVL